MKSLFFIPVFNEYRMFSVVLDELRAAGPVCDAVLLVNNGSTDGSEKLVRQSGFPYIDLPKNLGIGFSFIKAVDWALERQFDIFGSIAGNGKMLAAETPRVLDPILRGEADYVTGSRFLPGGSFPNLPLFRRSTIPMVNQLVKVLTGISLTDATCGFRAMRLDILRSAQFDWHASWLNTYGFEYYLYGKVLLARRYRWKEVPITMRYPPAGQPYTKMKAVVSWYQMIKPWVVARFDGKGFCPEKSTLCQQQAS
ncbi:MAG: glycosyltransferase family 2 protein [Deltaproteobacteria bacterium]|nr:glycosyltransferase family 2 protein [Deltaproteobacteria bacterium]